MPKPTYQAPQDFEDGIAPFIAMDSVDSSQVKAIGFDPETKTLAVKFTRGLGATYHYPNVSQETYEASISLVQRKMKISYNAAARLIELMELRGVVSTPSANGHRSILATAEEWPFPSPLNP
jgi:DNA segregation ATPase FtsK/SpoIIIE-like protein